MKKITNQRDITQKQRKGDQSFLYATRRIDLINIAFELHRNFPNGYLVNAGRPDGQTDSRIA